MHKSHKYIKTVLFSLSFLSQSLFAAQVVDLYYQPTINATNAMQLVASNSATVGDDKITRKMTDSKGITHIHIQQMYQNIPVWNGQYIMHVSKKATFANKQNFIMNGTMYKNLQADLVNTPNNLSDPAQIQRAINEMTKLNHEKSTLVKNPEAKLMVYVDEKHTAHYVYLIQFTYQHSAPTYLVDALTFKSYKQWNNYKTLENVTVGGWGGNRRSGVLYYDGQPDHLPTFTMQRDPTLQMCYVRDSFAVLRDLSNNLEDIQFKCETPVAAHGMYWDGQDDDRGNGGYSPSNDTLYAADVMNNMFIEWFNLPVWTDRNGKPARMVFWMHDPEANAAFTEDGYIIIGDSLHDPYFPFTTLDIVAHEMGHAVTAQNSNLYYNQQSGGLNESFSDMTGKTAEFYAHGKIDNWNLGAITGDPNTWLRYMDQPSKDCPEEKTDDTECSVDNMQELADQPYLDVHYTSGIYNRFFYLLATSPDWDIKKAYQLMFHANQNYWTNFSDFCQASRGVWLAAQELGDDDTAILNAFSQVGLDPKTCQATE